MHRNGEDISVIKGSLNLIKDRKWLANRRVPQIDRWSLWTPIIDEEQDTNYFS